jgi:hypothetical protein
MQSLRTFDTPFYTMTTVLDGTDYLFEFRYNQRENCWYFSVSTTDGVALVSGVKIVSNRPLLSRFADVRLPPGMLVAFANTTDASPPGLADLGEDRRVTLIYYTAAEIASS